MKAVHRAIALSLAMVLTTMPGLASITVSCWDAASEFNDSANPDAANPSGVWSYGWKEALTGKFLLALTPFSDPPNVSGWTSGSGFPLICHLSRSVPTAVGVNPATFPPGALCMHPGPNGEYAVLRFTAPADGDYKVSGQFFALDDNETGTTTDVWILQERREDRKLLREGRILRQGKVDQFHEHDFPSSKKGETLDFEVGYGANKNYFYDSTGLVALIEKVK